MRYKYIIYISIVCLMTGCSITRTLNRKQTNVQVVHSPRKQREYVAEKEDSPHQQGYIEYTHPDGRKDYLIPTSRTDGENMITYEIEEVTVIATSRMIPERMGKVNLDFIVTLPKELMGRCRIVEVIPTLHTGDSNIPLEALTIRGALFNKVQERNYWQYDRYIDVFSPDEDGRERAFERFIYYPYPEDTRLDSVVTSQKSISYFYTQEVTTENTTGNTLRITLSGTVTALDHSDYCFPLSDTLTYNISSMLTFTDTTTRYITQVIEKFAVVNDRNYLNFRVNRSEIIDTLANNQIQLDRIEGLMDKIINQREFHIDSIILTASASPEGSVSKNNQLAKERAFSLRDRLIKQFPKARLDTLVTVKWLGEDWNELVRLLRDDSTIKNKAGILELINRSVHQDRDVLEREISRKYPKDYNYMLEVLYPKLRAVSFKYDLRRVGMVKDTIHTTVPDTHYARGIELLKLRKYTEALAILAGFNDRNTAICLLSLGNNEKAYRILNNLKENSFNAYLMAIACVRTERREEAVRYFNRACNLNENMRLRGRLDPEILPLINEDHD